jgi:hypothetical protein
MRTLFYSVFFSFALVIPVMSESGHGPSSRIADDCLRWDDLVIRGIVANIAYETIPADEWYSPALRRYEAEPVRVAKITLSVKQVLRGRVDGAEIVLYARQPQTNQGEIIFNQRVTPGAELLAMGLCNPLRDSAYLMHGVFARSNDGWSRLSETGWGSPITQREIEDRVGSVSVPTMTRESDLVIRGTILTGEDVGEPGNSYRAYLVRTDKVFKGSQTGNIQLKAEGTVGTEEEWRLMLPFDLDIGTSWYLFLMKSGDAYVPTAARRSAFKVSGNDLFENLNVPSGHNVSGLEKDLRQFANE